jgi:hypothetical protein
MTYIPTVATSIQTTAKPTGDYVEGKPVFRKIVKHTGSLTAGGANNIAHGISSFSKILRMEGTILRSSGTTIPLDWHDRVGATNFHVTTWADATDIIITLGAAWSGAGNVLSDPWVIIEYVD